MSGGYFDYVQFRFQDCGESLARVLNGEEKWTDYKTDTQKPVRDFFSAATIEEFKTGLEIIKKAAVYAHRIDWLLSDDDTEDCFHERLKNDLGKLKEG